MYRKCGLSLRCASAAVLFSTAMLFSLAASAGALQPEQSVLHLYTEYSPPGEYLDSNGEVAGATVELIKLLLQLLDQPATIELLPWARALERAQLEPNSGVFETVRNQERETRFKWVGPLKMHTIGLYGRNDVFNGRQINPIVSNNYLACEYRKSVHVNTLKRLGFAEGRNLVLTVNHGDCFKLLVKGRVQLVVLNEAGFAERQLQMQQAGYDLVFLQPLNQVRLYLALSVDIDDSVISRWQQVLEQSYLDGSMRALYQGVYSEQMINRLEQFAIERQMPLQ